MTLWYVLLATASPLAMFVIWERATRANLEARANHKERDIPELPRFPRGHHILEVFFATRYNMLARVVLEEQCRARTLRARAINLALLIPTIYGWTNLL